MHEAQLYGDNNSFITLTYSDDFLPEHSTLVPEHWTIFIRELRRSIYPATVRYYMCGEYGENFGRPHYHAILFGLDFPDKTPHARGVQGITYTSPSLEKLWGKGFCTIGTVTFESAAYCARYVIKKQLGKSAGAYYRTVDKETGELVTRLPEYARMSLRPGIASDWFEQNHHDVFPSDHVILKGHPVDVPKYYDRKLEQRDPALLESIKERRAAHAEKHEVNNTKARLKVREKSQHLKLKRLKRTLA